MVARRGGQATLRAAARSRAADGSADPLVLRRILENLVGNAVDSLAGQCDGAVTVTTEPAGATAAGWCA